MKRLTSVVLVGVSQLPASVMGDLAAAMKPGEWRELGGVGLSQAFLETAGFNAANHSILQYGAKGSWDPNTRQFLFLGSPHDNPYKFILYSDSAHQWRAGPLPLTCMEKGHNSGGCNVHSYYYSCMDVAAGRYLYWNRGTVYQYDIRNNRWGPFSTPAPGNLNFGGFAYFPERGIYIVVSGWEGHYTYNIQTRVWSVLSHSGLNTSGNYHMFAYYNPVHQMVLFGGGNYSSNVLKMAADGSISAGQNSPVNIRSCPTTFTIDPVTGNGLLLDRRSFWVYDMTGDNWSALPPPPSLVQGLETNDCGKGVVAAPVSTYGVVLFLTFSPAKSYLYRHAAGTGQIEGKGEKAEGNGKIQVHPNPFRGRVLLTLPEDHRRGAFIRVFDAAGRLAADLTGREDGGTVSWNSAGRIPGIYFVTAENDGRAVTKKIVLTR